MPDSLGTQSDHERDAEIELLKQECEAHIRHEGLTSFDALTVATVARFPHYPPYQGAFASPVPHLTVAQQPLAADLEAVTGSVLAATAPHLPLACSAREVALAFKRKGRWSIREWSCPVFVDSPPLGRVAARAA